MTLWKQLQDSVQDANRYRVSDQLQDDLIESVEDLSIQEGCPPDEMILILLDQAVKTRRQKDQTHICWDSLSPREKQVIAYVCMGLTGRQIAAQLVLSPETVKTHVRHALRKFNLNSRQDLRRLLKGWDLSPWLDRESYIKIS